MKFLFHFIAVVSIGLFGCAAKKAATGSRQAAYAYDFGSAARPGFIKVSASDTYNDARGYGFEPGSDIQLITRNAGNTLQEGFVTSRKPFLFSVKLPEGNYHIKLTVGDQEGTSDLTIRTECRRMMANRIHTKTGELQSLEYTIHIRDTLIKATNDQVRLKPRERNYFHWDNKLTLEFNGEEPKVAAIEITPASPDLITVFLAGNSTVVDQAEEPYASWGQIIPAYFWAGKVVVANYAESGESLSSFIAEKRMAKMLSLMKAGDYAFAEFGHNDQKQKGVGIGAFTSYKKDLQYFINEVKKKGAIPVLVTPVQRRSFDSTGRITETLGDYPEAVRQKAREEDVALIDLNAMSKTMYEAWGVEKSIKAFVHFPANTFPGQTTALADNTHFTPFGAYHVCRIMLKGIHENKLTLAQYIQSGFSDFDPAQPESFGSFYWPGSPTRASVKPDGN